MLVEDGLRSEMGSSFLPAVAGGTHLEGSAACLSPTSPRDTTRLPGTALQEDPVAESTERARRASLHSRGSSVSRKRQWGTKVVPPLTGRATAHGHAARPLTGAPGALLIPVRQASEGDIPEQGQWVVSAVLRPDRPPPPAGTDPERSRECCPPSQDRQGWT